MNEPLRNDGEGREKAGNCMRQVERDKVR